MNTDQASHLRAKMKGIHHQNLAKTIAVVSGKGGVGKSNIALNFSLSLSKKGKKVLLFDLDIGMGNIEILLGRSSEHSILKIFEKNSSIYDIIESGPNTLSYIPGGNAQESIFQLGEEKLAHFLGQLELMLNDYDYVIFDLGAGVTQETIHYMKAVDDCLVVTTPEPTSITDAYSMVKHILSYKKTQVHLILNRVMNKQQGDMITNRMITAIKRFLEYDMFPLGMVPDDPVVMSAVIEQHPFLLKNPKSKASVAIDQITDQFLGIAPRKKRKGKDFLKELKQYLSRL
ncbi:MinD/ParA family protein [Gracilibacillus dipsosauri]|uniref:Cobyrinic acid a,c-diamide synthase n=1 Tax=Gracilibacillus dipsosauri TaxID=178340 RepID=A0A317KZL0_9BACI|nr:MinD/ParA family protein [Gracilibacillus dipsosauri]PWU68855.1 cobyrinic acid a,c-diamide synthase [Gracilibacillus dipsosauri]